MLTVMGVGCSHPLVIVGKGDIISASGNRNCTWEQYEASDPECAENYVLGNYLETYTAVAEDGWKFRGWQTYCAHEPEATECNFNIPARLVRLYWGETYSGLRAEFIPDCNDPGCLETIAPVLGAVTDSSIKIWQATASDAAYKILYRTGTGPWNEASTAITSASGYTGTIELTGLQAGTEYEYETQLDDYTYYTGSFSTLPSAEGFNGQINFGMGTDFYHHRKPYTALEQAAARDFDFMLMIGDLMYSDVIVKVENTPEGYADRYWVTWDDAEFAALSTTTPMLMMWDDHEIADDFWPGKETPDPYPSARTAFDRYVASHNPDTDGDVLYYTYSAPGADFFVLDTRSYRDPATDVDDIDKSMIGETQRAALLDYLQQSTAPFKFIVTSVPFSLGEASPDTWSHYKTERDLILSEIESRGIANVAFMSGDRHWTGIFRIISPGGHVYYDFLPSPTAASNRTAPTGNAHPEEEEIVFITDQYKIFGDFLIDLSGATPTLRAAMVDENGNDQCVITIGNDETGVPAGPSLASCQP